MQNMRKGVQIYTVREHIDTQEKYETALRKIREIGYDSVQTYGWKCSDIEHKAFLDEHGISDSELENVFDGLRDAEMREIEEYKAKKK